MGVSSITSTVTQNATNRVIQQNNAQCVSSVVTEADGNFQFINGSVVAGDVIGVNQQTNTDATCEITSNMDAAITSILNSLANQKITSANDLLGGLQVTRSKFDLRQNLTNYISQLNQSVCNASSIRSANNNFQFVSNSRVGGNVIGVNQASNASARCSIQTLVKAQAYNELKSGLDQGSQITGLLPSIFGGLFSGIFGIIALVVIGAIILLGLGILGYVGYSLIPSRKPSPATATVAQVATPVDQATEAPLDNSDLAPYLALSEALQSSPSSNSIPPASEAIEIPSVEI